MDDECLFHSSKYLTFTFKINLHWTIGLVFPELIGGIKFFGGPPEKIKRFVKTIKYKSKTPY